MPTTTKTKTIVKAIISKSKARPKKANATRTKNRKGKKRNAVSSDDDEEEEEEEEEDESAASETQRKKKVVKKVLKKASKRRHVSETDDEIEMIDAPEEMTVEEVDAEGSEPKVHTYFYWEMHRLTNFQDDGLNEHQWGPELEENPVKKDLTRDLLTIMSDKVTVKFKIGTDKFITESGRWCNPCR